MTDPDPLAEMALRPGRDDLETEMWADALVKCLAEGKLDVPLLVPKELLDEE